jgi:hypothetical protein
LAAVNGFTSAGSRWRYAWHVEPSETIMQRYPDNLSEADRRIARRFTLASVGFYGSILAGLILYGALSPHPAGKVASMEPAAKFSVANAARQPGSQNPGR